MNILPVISLFGGLAVFFSISLALSVAAASTQGKKQDNQGKLAGY